MWIVMAVIVTIVSGLISPFCARLHATGLWVGKALVDPAMAQAMPNGLQNAVTDGWPSSLVAANIALRLIAVVLAFVHAWWAAPLVFIFGGAVTSVTWRTQIASKAVERYIGIFTMHALRRHEAFRKAGDLERAELAEHLTRRLEVLLATYMGRGIPAPEWEVAREAPFGDGEYLLRRASEIAARKAA
jgi:hypothetical protein